MNKYIILWAAMLCLSLATGGTRSAESMSEWYKSLEQPGTGINCCDESDCKRTVARPVDGGWEAMTPEGTWVMVPPEKIIWDKSHPLGAAVLCYLPIAQTVLCFVPPTGAG